MANFRNFFHEYFNLMPDKESEAEVIEGIAHELFAVVAALELELLVDVNKTA